MSEILIYTNSMLFCLRQCPKKCELRHIRGIRTTIESEALGDGRLWHSIMEMAGWDLNSTATINAFIETECLIRAQYPQESRCAKFMGMYAAYLRRGLLSPQRREVEFCIPLVNPATGKPALTAQLAGKIDGILTDEDGTNWIVEHKTASQIRPEHLQLDMNFQTALYSLCADVEISGIIYDVIRKPSIIQKLKRKVPQTAADYQDEVEAWYDEDTESKFYRERLKLSNTIDIQQELWNEHNLIRYRVVNNFWPRNTDSCFGSYGNQACDYYNYCVSGESPFVLQSDYIIVENVHPELSENIGRKQNGTRKKTDAEKNDVREQENNVVRPTEDREVEHSGGSQPQDLFCGI